MRGLYRRAPAQRAKYVIEQSGRHVLLGRQVMRMSVDTRHVRRCRRIPRAQHLPQHEEGNNDRNAEGDA